MHWNRDSRHYVDTILRFYRHFVDKQLRELVEVGRLSREPLHFAVHAKELHVEAMAFQFLAAFRRLAPSQQRRRGSWRRRSWKVAFRFSLGSD
jgi:hypothetical protein